MIYQGNMFNANYQRAIVSLRISDAEFKQMSKVARVASHEGAYYYKVLNHNYKIYMNYKLQRGEPNGGLSI